MMTTAEAQEPNFARALTMTSTDLVIGQPVNWYGPGMVYTYRLDANGAWQERARLVASDSARMDDFGRALALDGNTLVVGAPRKRGGKGVAYVFARAAVTAPWRQAGIIEPPVGSNAAEFATALHLAGDDLLIGSPLADSAGAVHHYRRSGSSWTLHRTITAALPRGAQLGRAIARNGEWLLVGAPSADSAAGRVVSLRMQGGDWSAATAVSIPRPTVPGGARTGTAITMDRSRAYVGAPGASTVFVLSRDSTGRWAVSGDLHPFDATRNTQFGFAVATVAGEVWVGAPAANGASGRVYRFAPDARDGWQRAERLEADSSDGSSWPFSFGASIASSGNRAVVGMPSRDFGEGRALAVAKSSTAWTARQTLVGEIHTIGKTIKPGDKCKEGKIGEFTCSNMELVSHMPVSALGGERGVWVNDVWGWTDPETGRDYALVARRDGASFVDVSNPSGPRLVGNLPRTKGVPPSVWRDIKVVANHAYIVADGADAHGMQVFDLTRLRRVGATPVTFSPDTTYHHIASAHNVVADTASGFVYVVGANGGGETCGGGLHMVDVRSPKRPVFVGCYSDRAGPHKSKGYTHDAQCLVYRGPDSRYTGRQICVGSNETEINIADVTDKTKPATIGRNSYPNVSYAHQGWFDDEQRFFYMNDEGDELAGVVKGTRTIVWDLAKLDDPIVAREYIGPVMASDHNLFVKGDRIYESNYGSGLRVLDIKDRTNPREVGFFDSAPLNANEPGHSAGQSGAWSNYPFFKSGVVIFTSVREGLFIVKLIEGVPIS
jgi:choice-of-anchor B domain-containing protein